MPVMAMRILVIGDPARPTGTILRRLASRGWGAQYVETLREAQNSLLTFQFDVVLSAESLADGRGYEVADLVMRRAGTLIVGVALSASCLWLPVIEQGARVLGSRALNAHMLESELEAILAARERAHEGESAAGTRISADRAVREAIPLRRKGASVGSA